MVQPLSSPATSTHPAATPPVTAQPLSPAASTHSAATPPVEDVSDVDPYDLLNVRQRKIVKRMEVAQKIATCVPPILFILSVVLIGLGVAGLINPLAGLYVFGSSIGAWLLVVEPIDCCRRRIREGYGLPPNDPRPPVPSDADSSEEGAGYESDASIQSI